MKKILLSLLFFPLHLFAEGTECIGQFVIAPISSEKCEAKTISAPTYGIPSDNELLELLGLFTDEDNTYSSVDKTKVNEQPQDDSSVIYDISGRKQVSLQRGLNIIKDKSGNRKKIVVSE